MCNSFVFLLTQYLEGFLKKYDFNNTCKTNFVKSTTNTIGDATMPCF